jgi:hypothetical protein
MGKIKGWTMLRSYPGNHSYAWMNESGDILRIEKRKLYSKNLWYIDYRYGWKIMAVKGGKHPQEPYYSGTESLNVAKKFMRSHPNG